MLGSAIMVAPKLTLPTNTPKNSHFLKQNQGLQAANFEVEIYFPSEATWYSFSNPDVPIELTGLPKVMSLAI